MELSPALSLVPFRQRTNTRKKALELVTALNRKHRPNGDLTATVIGFDPGGTTGYSIMSVHPEALFARNTSIIENMEYWTHGNTDCGATKGNLGASKHTGISTTGESAGIAELVGLTRLYPGAGIVVEDFIPRKFDQSRDFLSSVRITACLNYALWLDHRDYHVQQPAFAKTTVTDERLRSWGFWDTHATSHARDADRHCLTFLRQLCSSHEYRAECFPALYGKSGVYYAESVQSIE